ncbi:bactofilin family protein [Paenibacillus apiarius]|uniref:bactofilin family protein n=1 Tax=Paenibacillus apiarius TaxID=46240 RepID=UPI00197EA9FE|nr:polymer-forming cytoskeletal protein [Paenibacillus apiarius]MBN3523436.1 polymer-forming cytoskeletal protein [Paenibacillus apiarius]
MFRRRAKYQPQQTDTFIGHGAEFEGNICCESNIRIDGKFKGEIISSGSITIGDRGEAHSTLSAGLIVIAGTVVGDIHASGKLLITSTGKVCGNCESAVLVIEEGGILNGTSLVEQPAPAEGHSGAHKEKPKEKGSDSESEEKKVNEKQAG